ncbi:hypothetical protein J6590_105755, partial [Homalodisca vitripennis]
MPFSSRPLPLQTNGTVPLPSLQWRTCSFVRFQTYRYFTVRPHSSLLTAPSLCTIAVKL